MLRKLGLALLVCLLLVGTMVPAQAGPLSGGSTIYVIDGVERQFTFDPILRHDGQLVPVEVVQALGLAVTDGGDTVTVARGDLQAALSPGRTAATLAGQTLSLAPALIRIGGRLFFPVALLAEMGYEITYDSNLLYIRDLVQGTPLEAPTADGAWAGLKAQLTIKAAARSDDHLWSLPVEATLLTPDLVAGRLYDATYRQRAELLDLLRSNTLVEVKLTNPAGRPATLQPAALSLLDNLTGRQYDVIRSLDLQGLISQHIIPGATKRTVLVYPLLPAAARTVTLYCDTNPDRLGTFTIPQPE